MGDLIGLQADYLNLIRVQLPQAAKHRSEWPVRLDHCFARIILDHICGGAWRTRLAAPAYKHLDESQLRQAIALGQAILDGSADLQALNRQSLLWRGKA